MQTAMTTYILLLLLMILFIPVPAESAEDCANDKRLKNGNITARHKRL